MKILKKPIVLLFFCTLFFSCRDHYTAVNGKIDLTNFNYSGKNPVHLSGQWEFYPYQLLTGEDFIKKNAAGKNIISVPGNWDLGNNGLNNCGYGTYRLLILTNQLHGDYSLYFHPIYTAYKVFVNGKLLCCAGKVGQTKQETIPRSMHQNHFFATPAKTIELIIQVSNFHHRKGGIFSKIYFGTPEQTIRLRETRLIFSSLMIGSILFLSLFHLLLFLLKKNDLIFIIFSLSCTVLIVRGAIVEEIININQCPLCNFTFLLKLKYLFCYLSIPLFNQFCYLLYPSLYSRRFLFTIHFCSCFPVISLLFTSSLITSHLVLFFLILCFASCIHNIIIIFKAIKLNKEAYLYLAGSIIYFITLLNDSLYHYQFIHTDNLNLVGLFILCFFQTVSLVSRFNQALQQSNYLNQNLKKEVIKKTSQLRKKYRRQKNFYNHFAHDIKTPLTLISNLFDVQIEDKSPHNNLFMLKNNIDLLKKSITNLLDYEKIYSKKRFYKHNEYCDFSQLIKIKMPFLIELARKKNIKITTTLDEKVILKADSCALDRILNNLLDNAIKFTQPAGLIEISLKEQSNVVLLSVRDTGIGISPDQLKKIFKPYYQILPAKSSRQGMGLGLNIVKKTVKSLDGSIHVNSIQNKGTKFTINFNKPAPINEKNSINRPDIKSLVHFNPQSDEVQDSNYFEERKSIFIIEDDLDLLLFLKEMLSQKYNIFVAINGKHALNKIQTIPLPQLIIVDIMMDQMDGYQFLEQIKTMEKFSTIPYLILTAINSRENKIKSLQNGAIGFMEKPFSIQELEARISSILNFQKCNYKAFMSKAIDVLLHSINDEQNIEKRKWQDFENRIKEYNITRREKDIILLLSEGYEYKEIAYKLSLSTRTIGNHIQNIYQKTNVHNKVSLIKLFH